MERPERTEILEEIREWLGDDSNRSFMRDEPLEEVYGILHGSILKDEEKCDVASELRILSDWHLKLGIVQVADENVAGWTELLRGMRMLYCHCRILVRQWESDPRRNKPHRVFLLEPSLCLAMALALDRKDVVDWLGPRLEMSVQDGAFGSWMSHQLPSFMLTLYRRYSGDLGAKSLVDGGPYAKVFANWNHEDTFVEAVRDACDFHVEQAVDEGDRAIGEFAKYPFNIIAFEILAIAAVRHREGLGMPAIDHPLLAAPFNAVPANVPEPHDDLLEKVSALAT